MKNVSPVTILSTPLHDLACSHGGNVLLIVNYIGFILMSNNNSPSCLESIVGKNSISIYTICFNTS